MWCIIPSNTARTKSSKLNNLCHDPNQTIKKMQLMSRMSVCFSRNTAQYSSTVERRFVFIIILFFSKDYMYTSFNCPVSLHVNTREICTLQIAFLNSTPFDTLKKNGMLRAINIIHKWSTVGFFLVVHKIISKVTCHRTQSKVFYE